ncbi:MAG: site-specific integrase [Pseudomonadota bacterium]
MPRKIKGVSGYTDSRGKRRWRYRSKGVDVPLGSEYGSAEFYLRLEAAQKPQKQPRSAAGTLDALILAHYASPVWKALSRSTQITYGGWFERLREGRGNKLIRDLRRRDVLAIMSKMSDTPAAANNMLRALRMLIKTALDLEWRADDPTLGVKKYPEGKGFHTWTELEIQTFYETHKPGTLAHTAMTLILYTGAARSDVVRLGWQSVKDGKIRYRRKKMESRGGDWVEVPIHGDLAAVLDTLPRDHLTFLQTRNGSSRSAKAFGNVMRKWCDAAGLRNCSSHGLRKAIARRLAEAGATSHEIASVTGHESLAEVERYTKAVARGGLAETAILKLKR